MKNEKIVNCHCEEGTPDAAISNPIILALGSEFDTRLALYIDNTIYFSENTGEIAENPQDLEKFILDFLTNIPTSSIIPISSNIPSASSVISSSLSVIPALSSVIPAKAGIQSPQIKPNIIIADLHPLYNSTQIGKKLAKKFGAQYFQLPHHLAHIFTAFGDYINNCHSGLDPESHHLQQNIIGIACDGTGYGWDGKIWGGEVFYGEKRIGHLEEQTLIGGDLSIEEPARILISILAKVYPKNNIFPFVKKYYSKKEFEVIYSQLSQNFNCQQTTSTGRILDAISTLLGFCENKRKYKHYAAKMLEKKSLPTRKSLKPQIQKTNYDTQILKTTNLIKYIAEQTHCHPEFISGSHDSTKKNEILKQVQNDTTRKEIATLSQIYIIDGLYKIAKTQIKSPQPPFPKGEILPIFFAGGFASNKIMKKFAAKNNIYIPQKISPGDDGIAAGQIVWYLSTNPRHQIPLWNIQFLFP